MTLDLENKKFERLIALCNSNSLITIRETETGYNGVLNIELMFPSDVSEEIKENTLIVFNCRIRYFIGYPHPEVSRELAQEVRELNRLLKVWRLLNKPDRNRSCFGLYSYADSQDYSYMHSANYGRLV